MPIPTRASALTLVALLVGCTDSTDGAAKSDDTGAAELDPRAPWVTIQLPDGGAVVTEFSQVTLTGVISDYDTPLEEILVTWVSATGTELCGGSAPNEEGGVSCTFEVTRGDSPVSLVAFDGEFEGTAAIDLVVRTADPPTVVIEAPADGGYVNEGESFTVEATVEDDNDAPNSLTLLLESDIDGTVFQGAADPSGEVHVLLSDLSLGDHVLTMAATDRDGFVGTASINFEVNSRPGKPSVHIEPTGPGTGEDIEVVIDTEAPDADGDSLTYRYTWYRDGELATGEVDATVSASSTAKGEVWSVDVQAADGRSVGEAAQASTTIENTAPEVSSAVLTPDPATAADTLTCAPGSTSDADGDTVSLSYSWQVAGVVRPETTATLDAGIATLGNSVVCTIIPTDGEDAGAAVRSDTVVLINAAPSTPEISVSPTFSDPGAEDLVCSIDVASTDADGDAVSYSVAWTADGLAYPVDYSTATGPSTTTQTDDTVPATDTDLAEEWTCTVTPTDGVTAGTAATAEAVAATLLTVGDGATATGSTATHDATLVHAQAITLTDDLTVTGFGIAVDTLATSGTDVAMGLYDDSAGMPGSLLVETDLETLSTGTNELDSSTWVDVAAGDYWLVVTYDATDDTTVTADSSTTATVYTESDGGGVTLPATWSGTDTATEALYGWWLIGY